MNIQKITSLLNENKNTILSHTTKSERLDCIVRLFEQTFPSVGLSDAITGPITNMTAMMDNIEAQKLIGYIKQMKELPGEVTIIGFPGSQDYEAIMKNIQEFIS